MDNSLLKKANGFNTLTGNPKKRITPFYPEAVGEWNPRDVDDLGSEYSKQLGGYAEGTRGAEKTQDFIDGLYREAQDMTKAENKKSQPSVEGTKVKVGQRRSMAAKGEIQTAWDKACLIGVLTFSMDKYKFSSMTSEETRRVLAPMVAKVNSKLARKHIPKNAAAHEAAVNVIAKKLEGSNKKLERFSVIAKEAAAATHVIYDACPTKYTVRVMKENDTIDEYNGGNSPQDFNRTNDSAVEYSKLLEKAEQIAKEMAQEFGVPEAMINHDEDLLSEERERAVNDDEVKQAAVKPKCPNCGSTKYSLMPTDFETAKCDECGKDWDHGIVDGVNNPYEKIAAMTAIPTVEKAIKLALQLGPRRVSLGSDNLAEWDEIIEWDATVSNEKKNKVGWGCRRCGRLNPFSYNGEKITSCLFCHEKKSTQPDKHKRIQDCPLATYYTQLGLTNRHAHAVLDSIDDWENNPSPSFRNVARLTLWGAPSGWLAQGLVAEAGAAQAYHGKGGVKLYRGVSSKYAATVIKNALSSPNKKVKIKVNSADSWTDNKSIAENFGGLVISAIIPTSWIVSSYHTNKILSMERELIISAPEKVIDINRSSISVGKEVFGALGEEEIVEVDLTSDDWMHGKAKTATTPDNSKTACIPEEFCPQCTKDAEHCICSNKDELLDGKTVKDHIASWRPPQYLKGLI
jgi:hypothetical protein